jgi:hypothetical protein
MSKKSKKQTKVTIEPGSVILTPSFIERLQYDACFLETWLLAANVGNEYDDHGCTSYAESLIAEMPEELAPLANVCVRFAPTS